MHRKWWEIPGHIVCTACHETYNFNEPEGDDERVNWAFIDTDEVNRRMQGGAWWGTQMGMKIQEALRKLAEKQDELLKLQKSMNPWSEEWDSAKERFLRLKRAMSRLHTIRRNLA